MQHLSRLKVLAVVKATVIYHAKLLPETESLFNHRLKHGYTEPETCEKITHQSPASIWSL